MKKSVLIVVALALLAVAAFAVKTFTDKPNRDGVDVKPLAPEKSASTSVLSESDEEYFSKAGYALMASEAVGLLRLGMPDHEVVKALGEPHKKSRLEVMEVDGDKHQTWFFEPSGIELSLVGAQGKQKIESISIKAPCEFKTKRGIGVGSTKEAVLSAYKKEIDPSAVNSGSSGLVAGSIYGGLFFEIEGDHVSSIYIGAGAE